MRVAGNIERDKKAMAPNSIARKRTGKAYPRAVTIEKFARSRGHVVRMRDDRRLDVLHRTKDGCDLDLEIEAREMSVRFQICIPLLFKEVNSEVTDVLNTLNDWSRELGHPEFWTMGYGGRVHLCSMLIDDGHLEEMGDLVSYMIADILEFAEQGMGRVSEVLEGRYVPASEGDLQFYR